MCPHQKTCATFSPATSIRLCSSPSEKLGPRNHVNGRFSGLRPWLAAFRLSFAGLLGASLGRGPMACALCQALKSVES